MAECHDTSESVLLQVGAKIQQTPLLDMAESSGFNDALRLVNDTTGKIIDSIEGLFDPSDKDVEFVNHNTEQDLQAFISATVIYTLGSVAVCALFCVLRLRYPQVFSRGVALVQPAQELFAWIPAAVAPDTVEVADKAGLDISLMLDFGAVAQRVLFMIGLPHLLIVAPLNCFLGGNAAGEDYLSYLSVTNVVDKSWLTFVHALCVVYVIEVTCREVIAAQERFVKLRYAWLASMDSLQARTIMVRGIPNEYCSDTELAGFFEEAIPGSKVSAAYCVRDTAALLQFIEKKEALERMKLLAELAGAGDRRTSLGVDSAAALAGLPDAVLAGKVETPTEYMKQISEVRSQIEIEQLRLKETTTENDHDVCLGNGVITFESARSAEVVMQLQFSSYKEEWILSTPPLPEEVEWQNLTLERSSVGKQRLIGYALLAALFMMYLPLVMLITNVAEMINLGVAQPIWKGIAPTLGLQVMVSLLPNLLLLITRPFLLPVSEAEAQADLASWYFWFQLVFVVLSAPVGSSILPILQMFTTDLLGFVKLLAATLPHATHFYMNYLVLKWFSHTVDLLRPSVLAKYIFFSRIQTEAEAIALSEPEDQAFHGIGARAARWSVILAIGIVLSTVSPLMCLLTWIDFKLCRHVYGYLMYYAETKKPDAGGLIWVEQLRHVFVALGLYCMLMIGVLIEKSASPLPAMVALLASSRLVWYALRFRSLSWERRPVIDIEDKDIPTMAQRKVSGQYRQPELSAGR